MHKFFTEVFIRYTNKIEIKKNNSKNYTNIKRKWKNCMPRKLKKFIVKLLRPDLPLFHQNYTSNATNPTSNIKYSLVKLYTILMLMFEVLMKMFSQFSYRNTSCVFCFLSTSQRYPCKFFVVCILFFSLQQNLSIFLLIDKIHGYIIWHNIVFFQYIGCSFIYLSFFR